MKHEQHDNVEETLSMPKRDFVERCKVWKKGFNSDKYIVVENAVRECPISLWVIYNDAKCSQQLVSNTAVCPLCGNPVCPDCMNHNVDQISRVTGYLSTVSGWNASKSQEFADRHRYDANKSLRGGALNG